MRAKKVLLIENARNNGTSFAASLKRKYQVQVASSGKQGLTIALLMRPDIIVLDAASLRTSGNRICAMLRDKLTEMPIIHIQTADARTDDSSAADVRLTLPFTSRKLINRIERFVPSVAVGGEMLEVGPFCLNSEQQTLTTPWAEKKLTPKLVALLEVFMRNPNQTLERRFIMQQVWKTDYMGDTRTLDVHIRWIREILEPVPRQTKYLKTVRGVGYRLVIPTEDEIVETKPLVAGES